MPIPVPGPLTESWSELGEAVKRRAKLTKNQRELNMELRELEGTERQAEETFVLAAQSLYEKASAGDLTETVMTKEADKAQAQYHKAVADVGKQRGDIQRRLEALRRSLERADGAVERVLKADAAGQMVATSERTQEIAGKLETAVFAAQELSRQARDQDMAIQWLDQYLGRYEHVHPRQIGSGSGASFGSAPEISLLESVQRTKELQAELERIHTDLTTDPAPVEPQTVSMAGSSVQGGGDAAQAVRAVPPPQDPTLPPGWQRTASGTPYLISDDDD